MRYVKVYSKQKAVILNKEDYKIAANYTISKLKLSIVSYILDFVVLVFWLQYGIVFLLNTFSMQTISSFGLDWLMLMSFIGLNALLHFPLNLLARKIDLDYGFNKQSMKEFLLDCVKMLFILGILLGIVFALLLWTMETIKLWWLVGFVLIFCFIVLIQLIYPTIIAPMFNNFTPLKDECLKSRIQILLERVGFKSNGIYVMDASRRDGRLNAYFGGFGNSKRVVLFDTLLEKISDDGLIAILGHELGHFKHKDISRNIVISGFILFFIFAVVGLYFKSICLYIGLQPTHGSILILAMLVLPVFSFLFMPLQSYFSRKAEYEADKFGASCASSNALREALIRLVNENKAFPYSHPAYIFFYYSHPPLLDRLKALGGLHDRN